MEVPGSRLDPSRVSEILPLIRERRFDQAFSMVEKLSGESREKTPAEAFFLGALSLFGLGHVRQAENWVQQYFLIKGEDVASLYLKAYLSLHMKNFSDALLCWTRIVEMAPSRVEPDRLIHRLKSGEQDVFRDIQRPDRVLDYIPVFTIFELDGTSSEKGRPDSERKKIRLQPPGTKKSGPGGDHRPVSVQKTGIHKYGKFLLFPLAAIFIGAIAGISTLASGFVDFLDGEGALEIPFLSSAGSNLPPDPTDGFVHSRDEYGSDRPEFFYSSKEDVLEDFRQAREMILDRQVNGARRLLGKIELSNAGFRLKERAALLRDFIPVLKKLETSNNVLPADFLKETYMLRGAQVSWKGAIEPVRTGGDYRFQVLGTEELEFHLVLNEDQKSRWAGLKELKEGDSPVEAELMGQVYPPPENGGMPRFQVQDAVFLLKKRLE